jgi:hypothetical protein
VFVCSYNSINKFDNIVHEKLEKLNLEDNLLDDMNNCVFNKLKSIKLRCNKMTKIPVI